MSWKEAAGRIPWGTAILFGVGISLGTALLQTKAAGWLADLIVRSLGLGSATAFAILALLALFLIVIHLGFASATALASAMVPIMISVLQQVKTPGLNVLGMTLILQFVVSFGFILPVNAPQNMVAYGTDTFAARDFVRTGIVITIVGYALVLVFAATYWSWLGYPLERRGKAMAAKQILFHDQAREKMLRGATILADAVRGTLGPKARTVVLERAYGAPIVINSGVAVAKEIELPDPFENLGARMVREVASKTSEVAGDGTTTATLLAHAIVREGMKYVAAGMNPMDLKRGIDRAVAALVDALKKLAKPCSSRIEIANVASISANNDRAIGELVAEAMDKVGKEGVITVEDGSGLASELDVVEGMRFDRGFLSPYFINQPEKQRTVLEDALILRPRQEDLRDRGPAARCWRRWSRPASRCSSSPRRSRAKRSRRWS